MLSKITVADCWGEIPTVSSSAFSFLLSPLLVRIRLDRSWHCSLTPCNRVPSVIRWRSSFSPHSLHFPWLPSLSQSPRAAVSAQCREVIRLWTFAGGWLAAVGLKGAVRCRSRRGAKGPAKSSQVNNARLTLFPSEFWAGSTSCQVWPYGWAGCSCAGKLEPFS